MHDGSRSGCLGGLGVDKELKLAVPTSSGDDDRKLVQLFGQTGREPQVLTQPGPSPREVRAVDHCTKRADQTSAYARDDLVVDLALLGRHLVDRGKGKTCHLQFSES